MTTQIAVFQHVWWEGPGNFLHEAAHKCNADLHVIKVWEEEIPNLSKYDSLIILGGGPNVDQEKEYPFLRSEKQAIRRWLETDKPCLGICLGHQLLAEALGGKVAANFCHSIGFIEGHLTHNGRRHPAFRSLDSHFPLFKWHSCAVIPPVPGHFHILATSVECQVESFTIKERPHIIGVQFDNHAAATDNVAEWLRRDASWLDSLPDKNINAEKIIARARELEKITRQHFQQFFANFIKINHTHRNTFTA